MDKVHCVYPDCTEPIYARGYCRKHYNKQWRKGEMGNRKKEGLSPYESETLRSLEKELEKVKLLYEVSYGIENRVKWRRDIVEIEKQIDNILSGIKSDNSVVEDDVSDLNAFLSMGQYDV